jgi:copper chaperone CopZ
MTAIQFTVPAISCGHCVNTIERAVNEVEGVRQVDGNPDTKTVLVRYDPPATRDAIVAAMAEWDFPPASEVILPV